MSARFASAPLAAEIGTEWTPLAFGPPNSHYLVRLVVGAELGDKDPFRLLADGVAGARENMGEQTLVVAGATLADGMYEQSLRERRRRHPPLQ